VFHEHQLRLLRLARESVVSSEIDSDDVNSLIHWLDASEPFLSTLSGPIYSSLLKRNQTHRFSDDKHALLESQAKAAMLSVLENQQQLQELSRFLGEKGISVIALKGSAHGSSLYGQGYPRMSCDIDILVKPSDYDSCREILGTLGKPIRDPLVPFRNAAMLFEWAYRIDGPFPKIIEVHSGLTHPQLFNIDNEELWDKSRPHSDFPNDTVHCLCPEHTLLHLAIHGFRDLTILSHSLVDTFEIASQWKIDWKMLCETASAWEVEAIAHYWLLQAWLLLDAPIPSWVVAQLQPRDWRTMGLDWAFTQGRNTHGELSSPANRLVQLTSLLCGTSGLGRVLAFLRYRQRMVRH